MKVKVISETIYAYLTLVIVLFMFLIFLDGSTKLADVVQLALWSAIMSAVMLPVLLAVELFMAASQRKNITLNKWRI